MDLQPIGEPPSCVARWCPSCRCWLEPRDHLGRRRCGCGTALVRPMKHPPKPKPRPGELRPGVVAEFRDPRDWDDPARELAELRARLAQHGTP